MDKSSISHVEFIYHNVSDIPVPKNHFNDQFYSSLDAAGIGNHSVYRINKVVRDASIQQRLREFDLIVRSAHPPLEFSLQPLSDLHVFSFSWSLFKGLEPQLTTEISNLLGRCPNLEVLCLEMMSMLIKDTQRGDKTQSLEELFVGWTTMEKPLRLRKLSIRGVDICSGDFTSNIRHLRSLEDLTIELYPTPSELGTVFAMLQTEGIHLRKISVMALHPPEIIDYISSFTGLEGFSIESYDVRDDSRSLIHDLFSALKRHCGTLKSLRININRISPWQEIPRSHLLESAELFRSLETLEIRVHTSLEDAQADNAEALLAWLEIATRFPTLSQLKIKPVKWKTGEYSFPHNRDDMVEPGWKTVPAFRERILREFRREREFTFDIIYFKY
ncbi:hypothetical protein D9756_009392 [Leucocoprinus leucothites]|uniref:Uncharacterized protein n=1 Tax=Leucocoprinus leucothites TaxID=201217 RepID=A0A8H5CXX0_9AGAR|nr:hypothetical protein D9756_009392 [Leucoagaricus leucothites]